MAKTTGAHLLRQHLGPYEKKLQAKDVSQLLRDFEDWQKAPESLSVKETAWSTSSQERALPRDLLAFLRSELERIRVRLRDLARMQAELTSRCARAVTEEERQEQILLFARELGATSGQLRGDRKAFNRWFDLDAVTDRYQRQKTALDRRVTLCLRFLGRIAAQLLSSLSVPSEIQRFWTWLATERLVAPLFLAEETPRVAVAAFQALSTALSAVPVELAETLVSEELLRFIYRASLDSRQNVWIQCEALSLLRHISPDSAMKALSIRAQQPGEGDELFVRRRVVLLLESMLTSRPGARKLLEQAASDPAPFVRQQVAAILVADSEADLSIIRRLLLEDSAEQIRAAGLLALLTCLDQPKPNLKHLPILVESLRTDQSPFVLRTALKVASEGAQALAPDSHADLRIQSFQRWTGELLSVIEWLHRESPHLSVRRWAAQARERIWCEMEPEARKLKRALKETVSSLAPGKSRRLRSGRLPTTDRDLIGRVLAVLALEDFGFGVEQHWWGWKVTRDPCFGFRTWRFLHELRHPDAAKRQGFSHMAGRVSHAEIRAPSAVLAELAETKVPGEPLHQSTESGWRPYLPLVDDVISSLNQVFTSRPTRFYTSEGVTELQPPANPIRKLSAYLRLTWSFSHYARLRNWQEDSGDDPQQYLHAIERLGFQISFAPHQEPGAKDDPEDPAVRRFFPCLIPFAATDWLQRVEDWFSRFFNYFGSVFESRIPELIIFLFVAMLFFFGRHWYWNQTLKRARRRLPLVIGGWGTRGKSGTERLKAALIEALGYSLVSKTTGCEAMFLHAPVFGKTREMFLFRSYDKATIWEQRNLVLLSAELGAEVFLWECMGLNPSYVQILQRDWMRDDISTLTNTYPDHEDVQGPAGINIPQAMTRFIPEHALLLSSEEEMSPILHEAASRLQTEVRNVGWLEAGLLTPDVLGRFPYDEHPYNIALVLSLADELGVERDYALKAMADHVVPDLGVLKTSPPAPLDGRRIQFSNGMSANERHGCLSNWRRLGLDQVTREAHPGTWVCTVVNNRADRIPRSQVFAEIMVNDIRVDRHFLIGNNLTGLLGYIREAWEESAARLTLWPEQGTSAPVESLHNEARRLRCPTSFDQIHVTLRGLLASLLPSQTDRIDSILSGNETADQLELALQSTELTPEQISALKRYYSEELQVLNELEQFAQKIQATTEKQRATLDVEFRQLLWTWFERKLIVIPNYHATGEQIIDRIREETPPGMLNHLIGLQNIKGTGLDFVYRWEAWSECHRLCERLLSREAAVSRQAALELTSFRDFGLLSSEHVLATVHAVRESSNTQREEVQAMLQQILSNLEVRMREVQGNLKQSNRRGGWRRKLLGWVESILDANDALRRRKRANQIYKDLVSERISLERAALELQKLTKRQKGGWLTA